MTARKQRNRKLVQNRSDDYWDLRIYHRAGKGKRGPRYLIKCGCCENELEIYYDSESLEINGVMASLDNWREILLPLLQEKQRRRLITMNRQ